MRNRRSVDTRLLRGDDINLVQRHVQPLRGLENLRLSRGHQPACRGVRSGKSAQRRAGPLIAHVSGGGSLARVNQNDIALLFGGGKF
jgi:hypothetical protein